MKVRKIYLYKGIPYVVCEVINRDWEKLLKVMETDELPMMRQMYNVNGNWYLLESFFFYYFGITWWVDEGLIFDDSMHLEFGTMSDPERWRELRRRAERDIDQIWDSFFAFFKNL